MIAFVAKFAGVMPSDAATSDTTSGSTGGLGRRVAVLGGYVLVIGLGLVTGAFIGLITAFALAIVPVC